VDFSKKFARVFNRPSTKPKKISRNHQQPPTMSIPATKLPTNIQTLSRYLPMLKTQTLQSMKHNTEQTE
jgi:hypothetical protein